MKSFLEVCGDTRQKLGRELQKREIDFLQWLYMRYEEEEQKNKEKKCFSLTESSSSIS